MRVAVASNFGSGLSWWARLQDEGHEVKVWIDPRTHKTVGDGIVPKAGSWPELLSWAKEDPGIMLFDSSGIGEKADQARTAGLSVIGGGSFMDRLEKDRVFGQQIAESVGARVPPYQEFSSIKECAAFAKSIGDVGVYFKTDRYIDSDATHGAESGSEMAEYLDGLIRRSGGHGTCILQEKIEGVPFSTARWWNGMSWVGPYEQTYENKKLMNDNVGPSTGCAFNVVWFSQEDDPRIADLLGWEKLTGEFRKNHAPPGIYDINVIVDANGDAYFLEWTPRCGYDSEPTSARLIPDLGAHLWAVANGREVFDFSSDLGYSIRLSIPPYPWEHGEKNEKGSADGVLVRGTDGLWDGNFIGYCIRKDEYGFVHAGPEGIVGLSLATGDSLESLHDEVVDFAKDEMRVPGLMFRTDGDADVAEAAEKLMEAGIVVHGGLLG